MPTIRLKCLKPRHKVKLKQKSNNKKVLQIKKVDIEYEEYIIFIKHSENISDIKKLIYKQYSSSIDLERLKQKFKDFYFKNKYFRNYCKNNNISYHFLNRTSNIVLGSMHYSKKY